MRVEFQPLGIPSSTAPDLTKPSLAGLSYLLRHKKLWPEGFDWDYCNYETCAIGLCFRTWNMGKGKQLNELNENDIYKRFNKVFGMPYAVVETIFFGLFLLSSRRPGPITVANAIDVYLAKVKRQEAAVCVSQSER